MKRSCACGNWNAYILLPNLLNLSDDKSHYILKNQTIGQTKFTSLCRVERSKHPSILMI